MKALEPIVAARRSRSAGPILRKAIVDDIVAGSHQLKGCLSSQLGDSYMAKKSRRRAWTTADVRMLKTAAGKKTRASLGQFISDTVACLDVQR
jgi:hypothetical protein